MYLSDALKVIMRRWYIVIAGYALMIGAGVAAIKVVPTNHQASGQVLFLPPSEPDPDGTRVNPYLELPSGLTFTATLVGGVMATQDTQRELADAGFMSSYSVSVAPGTGPLLVVSVQDTDPAAALAERDEIITRIEREL